MQIYPIISYPIISPLYRHLRSFKHHVCLKPPGTSALHPFTAGNGLQSGKELGRFVLGDGKLMEFLIEASTKIIIVFGKSANSQHNYY